MSQIKRLLDDIINDTDRSYPDPQSVKDDFSGYATFDEKGYREKLSMFVLKDIICSMMHENPDDVDEMVDNAIMKHIHDNYDGSYYGYLCRSRDKLASPNFNMFGNIIQEIDERTKMAAEEAVRTKNVQEAASSDVKELLENVEDYETFTKKLEKSVTDQVVADVVKVITKSSAAPVFDGIDDNIEVKDKKMNNEDDPTTESYMLRMTGNIVTESAIKGTPISTDKGFELAVVQYCLGELDILCKQSPRISIPGRRI